MKTVDTQTMDIRQKRKATNPQIEALIKHVVLATGGRRVGHKEGIPYLTALLMNPNEGGYQGWLRRYKRDGTIKKGVLSVEEYRMIAAMIDICGGRTEV